MYLRPRVLKIQWKSRWGRDFPHPSRSALGPPNSLHNGHRISFTDLKWPVCGFDHPFASSAEDKDRVEVYLYSFSGPSWPVVGWTLQLSEISQFQISTKIFSHLNKSLKLGSQTDGGDDYIMLPVMLPSSKYMWLIFYLFCNFFGLPKYFGLSLIPRTIKRWLTYQ